MDIHCGNNNDKTYRREIFIVVLCLLIGFVLRFYAFDQKSLWIDEIHTFNDSRDDLQGQIEFYEKSPTYPHPPLFFILTHQFYPFTKPERDLRTIPLIFGTLSIPMIFFLSRLFSPAIAVPCTLALTFMVYHVYLSQDGRPYSFLLFFGMAALYFLLRHLETTKKIYLTLAALALGILFYSSYHSIAFILFCQFLWFYRTSREQKRIKLTSFFILNGLILLICIPWGVFVSLNRSGQSFLDLFDRQEIGSFSSILIGILKDWLPGDFLLICSIILLVLFPFFLRDKINGIILLATSILPIGGVYSFCKIFDINHFITSRYFVNFLPLFLISLFLCIDGIEARFQGLKRFLKLKFLFLFLFIATNLIILPLYYRSEKQDFRGLAGYLSGQLRQGDKIFVNSAAYIPGILHYFRIKPTGRYYIIPFEWKKPGKEIEFKKPFLFRDETFTIYSGTTCCAQYVQDGSRLWIVVGEGIAKDLRKTPPFVLKGCFDGSFSFFRRFQSDASMYLFLWDPKSPQEKGIDLPIE